MFEDWLDAIEDRMGYQFRYALELTFKWGLRVLSVSTLIICVFFAVVCVIASLVEGVLTWLLWMIPIFFVALVALFLLFLAGED